MAKSLRQSVAAVSPPAGARVVDLGCGEKPYAPIFEARGCCYVGCDIEGQPDIQINPDRAVPLCDGSADIVVSVQVIEHVWDLDWYLGECRRLLAPGRTLLLSTHGTWLYHPHPADYRRWTREGLVCELEQRGFRVRAVDACVGPLAWTTMLRLVGLRQVLTNIPMIGPALVALVAVVTNARILLEDAVTPSVIRDANAAVYVVRADVA
jgi:SAM-dependent methyltransferase